MSHVSLPRVLPLLLVHALAIAPHAEAGGVAIASSTAANSQVAGQASAASISKNGRFVAFAHESLAGLAPSDTNFFSDVYVKDLETGAIEHISVDGAGVPANAASWGPQISPDGRHVAFFSLATNLFLGAPGGNKAQVYVHDREYHSTSLATRNYHTGLGADASVLGFSMSKDGSRLAYVTAANNLVADDTPGTIDVFVAHRIDFTLERISLDSTGGAPNGTCFAGVAMSTNGRYVAFESNATDLTTDGAAAVRTVYLRDLESDVTTRVSRKKDGTAPNFATWIVGMSQDARLFALGAASPLLSGAPTEDLFLFDRKLSKLSHLGIEFGASGATQATRVQFARKGRLVIVDSIQPTKQDSNSAYDVFVFDRETKKVRLISKSFQVNGTGAGTSQTPAITQNGRYAAFESDASDIAKSDQNGTGKDVMRVRL